MTSLRYAPLRVLVYSSSAILRGDIVQAIGTTPDLTIPPVQFIEVATQPALLGHIDSGQVDLVILDGEVSPAGGLGIAKQLNDELVHTFPVVVMIARPQDGWLARWSRADAVVAQPVNPVELTGTVLPLLRARFVVS